MLASDERFGNAIKDRAECLVKRDINRPCVVFWSLGNESGYGKNMLDEAELIRGLMIQGLCIMKAHTALTELPTACLT